MLRPRRLFPIFATVSVLWSAVLLYGAQSLPRQTIAREQDLAQLVAAFERAVRSGDPARAQTLTAPDARNDYRWISEWKQSAGAVTLWRAGVLRWPPDAENRGRRFIHVSRAQVVQSTYDHLYEVASDGRTVRLGAEVPQTELVGARITAHNLDVQFDEKRRAVIIEDTATVRRTPSRYGFALYRLNENFRISDLQVNGEAQQYVQVGGFVATAIPAGETWTLRARYWSPLPSRGESFFTDREAAVTAYWYLHTARLPVTATVRIDAPAGWRSITTGTLVKETRGDRRWTSEWTNPIPVCFMMAVAGRYFVTDRTGNRVKVAAWMLQDSSSAADAVCGAALQALEWLDTTFSPYPYPEFTVVESRVFPPALEGYSFTLSGSGLLPGVVLHEASHTWWGGLLPNPYTKSMWNEAFATYTEDLYRRLAAGQSREPGVGAAAASQNLPAEPVLSRATDAMNPSHSAVGYQKGALVLAQLERLLGTETMLRSMREFLAQHRRGEPADWGDFERAVGRVAGPEWRGFFGPWLETPGLPEYQLADVRVEQDGGTFWASGSVTTKPPARWSLAVISVDTGGVAVLRSLPIKTTSTAFRFPCERRPVSVQLDPDGMMLRSRANDPIAVTTR